MEINGKTVLVTGASSGMGTAIAKEMALAGAGELLLLARNENDLKKVAAEIVSLGATSNVRFVPYADMRTPLLGA